MSPLRVIIFANGILPDLERARALLRPDDVAICADGGLQHAVALGLSPAAIIGDLDSLSHADRVWLSERPVEVLRHPHDKNETDLELALTHALDLEPAAILVVGALGNRLDQTLGNISLLTDPRLSGIDCRLDDGVQEVLFCRAVAALAGGRGDLVSLLPWGGKVTGARTQGLRWPLVGEVLYPEKTRGISNEMLGESASIQIETGLLLVVHRRQLQVGKES